MKLCDLTQFYSPVSGGVKRYLLEKSAYVARARPGDKHIWVIPGESTRAESLGGSKVYSIRSPLISRTSRYRFLWRLDLVEQILEEEMPDIVESGDPYQMAWKATTSARALGLACVGFYHSHFPEAYIRSSMKFFGPFFTEMMMEASRVYVRNLYNRFARTIVPSAPLAGLLSDWGVENVATVELGVDTFTFSPDRERGLAMRTKLGVPEGARVLLYVGRLAPEKNVRVLFEAFELLLRAGTHDVVLIVTGDGAERKRVEQLIASTKRVIWRPYLEDVKSLADVYRSADLFVHPGTQETFGLVTLESQACGTPVVAIRGSYMDRIIFPNLTHLARENTPAALAEAISQLLCEDTVALGVEASERVRVQYSWDQVFTRLFSVYEEVLGTL